MCTKHTKLQWENVSDQSSRLIFFVLTKLAKIFMLLKPKTLAGGNKNEDIDFLEINLIKLFKSLNIVYIWELYQRLQVL